MATVRIIIATVLGAMLLVAGLSIVPFVNSAVNDDDECILYAKLTENGERSLFSYLFIFFTL
jgi:hypothetical protein